MNVILYTFNGNNTFNSRGLNVLTKAAAPSIKRGAHSPPATACATVEVKMYTSNSTSARRDPSVHKEQLLQQQESQCTPPAVYAILQRAHQRRYHGVHQQQQQHLHVYNRVLCCTESGSIC